MLIITYKSLISYNTESLLSYISDIYQFYYQFISDICN